ncbi:hypothetical protein IGI04_006724 [Brassica rapa subsp. trilocularis]|uniref:Uncharacterized protein n=1 Tax=Brassica rapa subsp. trilocularis TaxID=1813537 RepID=A0ABQ7NHP2_BRACM|nr:hypothetical protein IGI04_006724 [Brassica rapa subsp. trilocularis]
MGLASLDAFASAGRGLERRMQDCGGKREKFGCSSTTCDALCKNLTRQNQTHFFNKCFTWRKAIH